MQYRRFDLAVVSSLVWLVSRRDLGWRRRRFVIAVDGDALTPATTRQP